MKKHRPMFNRFKEFVKHNKLRFKHYGERPNVIAEMFNEWATKSVKYDDMKILNRKPSKEDIRKMGNYVHCNRAFANKHVVRKWIQELT